MQCLPPKWQFLHLSQWNSFWHPFSCKSNIPSRYLNHWQRIGDHPVLMTWHIHICSPCTYFQQKYIMHVILIDCFMQICFYHYQPWIVGGAETADATAFGRRFLEARRRGDVGWFTGEVGFGLVSLKRMHPGNSTWRNWCVARYII